VKDHDRRVVSVRTWYDPPFRSLTVGRINTRIRFDANIRNGPRARGCTSVRIITYPYGDTYQAGTHLCLEFTEDDLDYVHEAVLAHLGGAAQDKMERCHVIGISRFLDRLARRLIQ
jgi:hypothetical protein